MTTYYERQTTLSSLVTAKGEDDAGLEFNAIVTAFANLNADLLTAIAAAAGGSDALHKFDATADPTVNDDSGDGYSPGSRWINTSTPAAFICLDASAGSAVWMSFAPSESLILTGTIKEKVHALSGTTPALDPANGSIQTWVLTANSSPTDSLAAGESITLMIDDGSAYTITWPTMQWAGGSAPDLATTGYTVVELWKVGSTLYGALVGEMS